MEDEIASRHRDWLLGEWEAVLDGWSEAMQQHGRFSPMERSWWWRVDQQARVLRALGVMDIATARSLVQARDPEFTGKRAMDDLDMAETNAFLLGDSHEDEDD